MIGRLIAAGLLPGLVACAQLQPFFAGVDDSRQVTSLIAHAQQTARRPADEQRRELAAAADAFARERSSASRLRLAMLLSMPGSAINDDARAATLLEPFAAGPKATPLDQLGMLLHAQVVERLKEQRRTQQLKEQIDALRAVEKNLMERAQTRTK